MCAKFLQLPSKLLHISVRLMKWFQTPAPASKFEPFFIRLAPIVAVYSMEKMRSGAEILNPHQNLGSERPNDSIFAAIA